MLTSDMLSSSLQWPDLASWHGEHGYSFHIADTLQTAYMRIRQGRGLTSAYVAAARMVKPLLKARMSVRQRLHMYFVMAAAYSAANEFSLALAWTDRALQLALRLCLPDDQIELLILRASLHRALSKVAEAAQDCRDCLTILSEVRDHSGQDNPNLHLHILSKLAMYEYFSAQHETLELTLNTARLLSISDTSHLQIEIADIEWVQALLYRTRLQPESALHHALIACNIYRQEGPAVSQDRIEYLVTITALEWAETLPFGPDRRTVILLAHHHLLRAEQLAKDAGDKPGKVLAGTARVHYQRLTGSKVDRCAKLRSALRHAKKLHDAGLEAEVALMLGDEMGALGNKEAAQEYYHMALNAVGDSELKVLRLRAHRAIDWNG